MLDDEMTSSYEDTNTKLTSSLPLRLTLLLLLLLAVLSVLVLWPLPPMSCPETTFHGGLGL